MVREYCSKSNRIKQISQLVQSSEFITTYQEHQSVHYARRKIVSYKNSHLYALLCTKKLLTRISKQNSFREDIHFKHNRLMTTFIKLVIK